MSKTDSTAVAAAGLTNRVASFVRGTGLEGLPAQAVGTGRQPTLDGPGLELSPAVARKVARSGEMPRARAGSCAGNSPTPASGQRLRGTS